MHSSKPTTAPSTGRQRPADEATVDVEDLTGDHPGIVRGEEPRGGGSGGAWPPSTPRTAPRSDRSPNRQPSRCSRCNRQPRGAVPQPAPGASASSTAQRACDPNESVEFPDPAGSDSPTVARAARRSRGRPQHSARRRDLLLAAVATSARNERGRSQDPSGTDLLGQDSSVDVHARRLSPVRATCASSHPKRRRHTPGAVRPAAGGAATGPRAAPAAP